MIFMMISFKKMIFASQKLSKIIHSTQMQEGFENRGMCSGDCLNLRTEKIYFYLLTNREFYFHHDKCGSGQFFLMIIV